MSFARASFSLLATLGLAFPIGAQTIQLRGELTNGRATGCYYCPGYEYVLKWSETPLASSVVSLAPFLDTQVRVEGFWDPTTVPAHFEVTAIVNVPESYSVDGNPRIGNRVRPNAKGTPGEFAAHFLAIDAGFVPLGSDLAMLLDPTTVIFLGAGTIGGGAEFKIDVDLPNDAALVGLRFMGQALQSEGAGQHLFSTNTDSKTISN